MFFKAAVALAFLCLSVESRIIIQSDNIGEIMDGPGKITIDKLPANDGIRAAVSGAQVIWD